MSLNHESSWVSVSSLTVVELIIAVVILLVYGPRLKLSWSYKKLPPGPFCWPVLGYLPFYNKDTGYINLKEQAKKYGGMFSIYIGSRYALVIDDFQVMKTAYSQEEFLGRPTRIFQIGEHMEQITLLAANRAHWKEQRKFFTNFLRFLGLGPANLRSIAMAEITDVISSLKRKENEEVNVDEHMHLAFSNLTFHMMFGKRFDHDHPLIKFLGVYDKATLTYIDLNAIKVFLPWLSPLVDYFPQYQNCVQVMEQMDQFIKQEILEHEICTNEEESRDFLDLFRLQMDKPGHEQDYNMETLLGNVKLQLIASSETSRTTLVWFLLLMAEHPEIQKNIQKQIDFELGREREPVLADKVKLPLLEAAILETLRFRNLLHYNAPRLTLEDTTLCGYDIPKDTLVIFNMTSHFRNPKYWTEPDRFDPNRFLSPDETKVQIPEHFVPFSYGKRNCPGEKTASSSLFLFSTFILQKFTVLPPEGGVILDIIVNFSNSYTHPFAKFKCRD